MRRPTEEEAGAVARMLEAGVPGGEAVDAVAPDLDPDVKTACGDAWVVDSRVRAARIALNGGRSWVAMSEAERHAYAVRIAYASMAYAVVSAPPSWRGEVGGVKRVLEFVDRVERHAARVAQAGVGAPPDGWTAFVEQVAKDARLSEALRGTRAAGVQ